MNHFLSGALKVINAGLHMAEKSGNPTISFGASLADAVIPDGNQADNAQVQQTAVTKLTDVQKPGDVSLRDYAKELLVWFVTEHPDIVKKLHDAGDNEIDAVAAELKQLFEQEFAKLTSQESANVKLQ